MVQSLHFDPKILNEMWFEPPHDKTNKMTCAPRDESSLCAQWVAKDPGFFMQTAKTDQMPRLIWVFAGRTGHFVKFCNEVACFSHAFVLQYYWVY